MRSPILISTFVTALCAFAACADLPDEPGEATATDPVLLEVVDASTAVFWSRDAEPDATSSTLAIERTMSPRGPALVGRPTPGDPNHYAWRESLAPIEACRAIVRQDSVGSRAQPAACTIELATRQTLQAEPHDFTLVRADDSWWQSLMVVWTGGNGRTEARPIVNSWPDINGAEELSVARVELMPGTTPRFAIEVEQVGETFACDRPLGWTYEERLLVVCEKPRGAALTCTTPIPVDVVEREQRYSEEGDLIRARTLRRFSLSVDYTEDGLRLRRGRGRVPTEWRSQLGQRTLPQLALGLTWRELNQLNH